MTWRGIVGNKRSEAIFVAEDGVDTLLNLIEHVPSSMHRQVRGALVVLSFVFGGSFSFLTFWMASFVLFVVHFLLVLHTAPWLPCRFDVEPIFSSLLSCLEK